MRDGEKKKHRALNLEFYKTYWNIRNILDNSRNRKADDSNITSLYNVVV